MADEQAGGDDVLADPESMDLTAMDPVEFANLMRIASDEQVERALGTAREPILDEIFKRMEAHFDPKKAAGVEAVVDWRITGRGDGGHDRYQLVISDGGCEVQRDGAREPRITFEVPAVSFLRLASGNVHGPALFLSGGLKIEGDMMLATMVQSFFEIPEATG